MNIKRKIIIGRNRQRERKSKTKTKRYIAKRKIYTKKELREKN